MKWKNLKHNGVRFPPEHQHRGLSAKMRGIEINLNVQQEEMAWAWAKKINTPYVDDEVFQKNFLTDFVKLLPSELAELRIDEIDFAEIVKCQEKERDVPPDLKKKLAVERKQRREEQKEQFGFAEVDGTRTEVASYLVEPPGIFMGRGAHPMRGKWKPRVYPEDVILNLGEDAPIPPVPISGRKWGKVIHDHDSTWLARWSDGLSNEMKYIWLADISPIRQERDKAKYDKAKKLSKSIEKVKKRILKGMRSRDVRERKVATVAYLIESLAMRVGDEKDEDEADTVGATTLRVEHMQITDSKVEFDFIGKDSVRCQSTLQVDSDRTIIENLTEFSKDKKPTDTIFDNISSDAVNRFLSKGMKGLTAKVFRTFHASNEVREYLREKGSDHDSMDKKVYHARMANLQAAKRCNHKRTRPKNWEERLAKKKEKLGDVKKKEAKTEKGKLRLDQRIEKWKLKIDLDENTMDYNLNTSLRNYIDPRIFKEWSGPINLDLAKIYPKTLQRKFAWVNSTKSKQSHGPE